WSAPQVARCQVTWLSAHIGRKSLVEVSMTGCVDWFVSWTPSTRSCPRCTEQAPVSWVSAGAPVNGNVAAGDAAGEADGPGAGPRPRGRRAPPPPVTPASRAAARRASRAAGPYGRQALRGRLAQVR